MGLDIYFMKRKGTNARIERALAKFYQQFNEETPVADVRKAADELGIADRVTIKENTYTARIDGQEKKVKYVTAYRSDSDEVAYFRKHNHLLPYFGYGENCTDLPVTRKMLQKFVSDARKVLRHWGKPDFEKFAEKVMPTCAGFFYGSTDYDDWYRDELEDEIEQLTKVIETTDFRKDRIVLHCWW